MSGEATLEKPDDFPPGNAYQALCLATTEVHGGNFPVIWIAAVIRQVREASLIQFSPTNFN